MWPTHTMCMFVTVHVDVKDAEPELEGDDAIALGE